MHHISYWIKNYALFSKPIRSKTNSNRELLVNVFNSFQPQPLSLTGNWFISLSTRTVIGYAINFLRCSIFRPRLSDYIHNSLSNRILLVFLRIALNPSSRNTKIQILRTDLHTFLNQLVQRICLKIKTLSMR